MDGRVSDSDFSWLCPSKSGCVTGYDRSYIHGIYIYTIYDLNMYHVSLNSNLSVDCTKGLHVTFSKNGYKWRRQTG